MAREVNNFELTHILVGVDNDNPWPEEQKFSVAYKDRMFEFYQRDFDSHWRVDLSMRSNLSSREENMVYALLLRAGFEPEVDRVGGEVKWYRPRSRPLWPDTVESFK